MGYNSSIANEWSTFFLKRLLWLDLKPTTQEETLTWHSKSE